LTVTDDDVDPAKLLSPLYRAVMPWLPAAAYLTVQLATHTPRAATIGWF